MPIDRPNPESPAPDSLTRLFAEYREACPEVEAGSEFMPRLWREIEGRRNSGRRIARFARALVATAAASCAVMVVLLLEPGQPSTGFYDSSYVDELATTHMPADLPFEFHLDNAR
jgi:hypothetical protein